MKLCMQWIDRDPTASNHRQAFATMGTTKGTFFRATETLTPRETEILHWLCEGRTYKEIAGAMSITVNTVRTHIKRIYVKLGVHSRTEAVVKTLRQNVT